VEMVDPKRREKGASNKRESSEPLTAPFEVLVDGREKHPYLFAGLRADARLAHRPLAVRWSWAHLPTGDYSLRGCEESVAIERKSMEDLYSTLGQHRDRFEAEHERMSKLDFAAVVIEASWGRIIHRPPERSRLDPKTVYRTAIAWSIRYRVPWFTCESRRLGEVTTFRLLERWWLELQEKVGAPSGHCRVCGRPLKGHRSWARGLGPTCAAKGDRALAMEIEKGGAQ
jgi:DNA excision repair protein ERCC-4